MKTASCVLLFCLFIVICCNSPQQNSQAIFIRGGTIIDLSENGKSNRDIEGSYMIIRDDTIAEIGNLTTDIEVPPDARIIDAEGKYILPGLIDGFAVINNQAYANAFLYMGITTLIGVDGGRRGSFFHNADPSPEFYMLESVGDDKKPLEDHLADLKELHKQGIKIALLKYALTPDQVKELKTEASKLGMGCIGELGYTSYKEAARFGIEVFVHTTRYSMDLAPRDMAKDVSDQPFSDDMNSPKWKYYRYLTNLDTASASLADYASFLAESGTFLMPTLSLLYLDLPQSRNPWEFPVARILNEKDINNPADRVTGKHHYKPVVQENYTRLGVREFGIEQAYCKRGAKYLAGSATDVWGTMPGISLHIELELLSKLGLSNREVIASATYNFHEAFGWKAGWLRQGFKASLIILKDNPLEDLDNLKGIEYLILNGKVLEREKLLEQQITD